MRWIAVAMLVVNVLAFYFFRVDSSNGEVIELPRPVGSARLILIDELNFNERNDLRLTKEEVSSDRNQTTSPDSFNLIRQPQQNEISTDIVQTLEAESEFQEGCEILGVDAASRSALTERLRAVGLNASVVEQKTEKPGPIMVYITPFASAREASLELSVLRREKIESFIISEGQLQNGISVGVFSTEQNALKRASQIEALGYATGRYQYMVEEAEYLIKVPLSESNRMGAGYWRELQSDFPTMTREQNSCF